MLHRIVQWIRTDVSGQLTTSIITQMMAAVSSSETSVNIYRTQRCNILEDSLHIRHRHNLKSHEK
jgi:hypothetical protein